MDYVSTLGEEFLEPVKESVKKAIEAVVMSFPEIKITSHTQGQTIYLNRLLIESGFKYRFFENSSIVEREKFEQINKDAELLIRNSKENPELSKILTNLKNCPERNFFEFTNY